MLETAMALMLAMSVSVAAPISSITTIALAAGRLRMPLMKGASTPSA
jgi:hypothetical protein